MGALMDGVCLQNKSYKPSNMAWATTEMRFYHSINGQKSINKKIKEPISFTMHCNVSI